MRIAYFSDNSYPELSGIVDSIHTTGPELAKRGHEIVYVGPSYRRKDYEKANRNKIIERGREIVHGLPIVRLPSVAVPFSPTGQSRFAFPIGSSFTFLDSFKPDIIHTQSPYGTGFEAIRAAKRYKVPLVGTNHTPVEEFYPWAPMLFRKFDAWYYNHCDFVTAPYQGLIDNMRQVGFVRDGRGQPNPVPFDVSPKSDEEKRVCKVDLSIPGEMIMVSGRLAPEKKVDVILRAFPEVLKEFPNATLVITGHGSSMNSLKELAQELKVEKQVRFAGFVNTQQMETFYCTAEVYVIMSTAETQSLSLMQAYAGGVPGIVARSRGLVDYCPPECGFQIEPGDSATLALKLKELLRDKELRNKLGQGGLSFVSKLSPAAIATQWEEIYASVIAKKS